eukprot:COSAG06_NODE_37269_length_437_cov_0.825444_1_plen_38_part_01
MELNGLHHAETRVCRVRRVRRVSSSRAGVLLRLCGRGQ